MKNSSANPHRPIGVFDSGLGGLTVVKALMESLPFEDIVYFGDTARVPYGTKSRESIILFSKQNTAVLMKHRVKMIVVACNSSSSHALSELKKVCPLPVFGVIEPGVRKAVMSTKNKKVGIIATPATINSRAYEIKLKKLRPGMKVIPQACPLFVPLVEAGWFDHPATVMIARDYLKKIQAAGADAVILGCTHYPLLKTTLKKVLGPNVELIDSANEVAGEVKSFLEVNGLLRRKKHKPKYRFLVSDEPGHFQNLGKRFLGTDIRHVFRCSPDG